MIVDFSKLLAALSTEGAEYIVIGGVAAIVHGSSRYTRDLDVVYRRSPENLDRIVKALANYSPYLRDIPPGLPFQWSAATLRFGLNFTLATSIGDVDLLGEITGGGTYDNLLSHAFKIEVFGIQCLCLDLPSLIQAKRAAGRPKDLEAIAELELILRERNKSDA